MIVHRLDTDVVVGPVVRRGDVREAREGGRRRRDAVQMIFRHTHASWGIFGGMRALGCVRGDAWGLGCTRDARTAPREIRVRPT